MARKGRAPKVPYADVPPEFRESIESASDEDIRSKIAQVALDQAELMAAKKQDEPLQEAREALKAASAIYREGTKMNTEKIAYARSLLEARGKL